SLVLVVVVLVLAASFLRGFEDEDVRKLGWGEGVRRTGEGSVRAHRWRRLFFWLRLHQSFRGFHGVCGHLAPLAISQSFRQAANHPGLQDERGRQVLAAPYRVDLFLSGGSQIGPHNLV